VAARLELLPTQKPRWGRLGVSAAGQLAFLGLLLLSPMIFPQTMQTALKFDIIELMQPVTVKPEPPPTPKQPPAPRRPRPKIRPKVKPPEIEPKPVVPDALPTLNPKQPHVFMVLKPKVPEIHKEETQAVELKNTYTKMEIILTSDEPLRPKEEVKPEALAPGKPAAATVVAALNKVQTGGFGDPNGVAGPVNPNKAGNIGQAGSPNLPGGPGQGNGTGGAQGVKGTVASGGGNGAGLSGTGTKGLSSGVAILSEPNPAYTEDARMLRMEGDVVLEVVFLASGQVQVVRVINGLGHGLDEAAIQAAKQIRFKPAKRDGQAFDFPARVRIEFRLAK